MAACITVPAGTIAACLNSQPDACDDGYVFDNYALEKSLQPWLSFAVDDNPEPLRYQSQDDVGDRLMNDGLGFEWRDGTGQGSTRQDAIAVNADAEPAFAVLFGSIARLRADGTVALGRSDERSNSPDKRRGQWDDVLPAAYSAWNDRLDVDLGFSYAGQKRFSTSVGLAEKIGNQNDDPAVVGWFEYRF